jgi:hypothetical protein
VPQVTVAIVVVNFQWKEARAGFGNAQIRRAQIPVITGLCRYRAAIPLDAGFCDAEIAVKTIAVVIARKQWPGSIALGYCRSAATLKQKQGKQPDREGRIQSASYEHVPTPATSIGSQNMPSEQLVVSDKEHIFWHLVPVLVTTQT